MKTRHFIMLLAGFGTLALVGCSPKEDQPTPTGSTNNAVDRATRTARDAATATGDAMTNAWNKVKDATYDERAQVRASLDQLATSVDAKVNELQARSASASESTRETWNRGLEKLREARTDFQEEIRNLDDATAETWDRAKANVATAWERVRQSYSELEAQRTTS